jgi:secreted PhoX family phosphatase
VRLLRVTPDRQVYALAGYESGGAAGFAGPAEFAGPTFSADERTLFANLKGPDCVLAVHGPFRTLG